MRFIAPAYEKIWVVLQTIEEFLTIHKTNHALIGTAQFEQNGINVWDAYQIIRNLENEKVLVIKGEKPGEYFVEFPADDYTEHIPELVQLEIDIEQLKEYTSNFQKKYSASATTIESESAHPHKTTKKVLQCGGLKINIGKATLQYKNKPPLEISFANHAIKFLLLLLNRDEIVEYTEIARELFLPSYREGIKNKAVARDIQFVRRDLGKTLKRAGMSGKEINAMIKPRKNSGYIIQRDYSSPKAHKKIT